MTTVTLRKATREDLPAILNLYVQAGFDEPAEIDLSAAVRIWERIQQYPHYSLYLAVQADEIVGTFALLILDNLAHHGRPSGIVEDMAVDPAHQGQGIGKAMMHFAMKECLASRVLQAVPVQQSKTRVRPPVLRRAGVSPGMGIAL